LGVGSAPGGRWIAPLLFRSKIPYNPIAIPGVKEATLKILKLRKEKLDLFASVVQQFGELHAHVEQDGKYVFKRLTPRSWTACSRS
jgi:hypothetical protein